MTPLDAPAPTYGEGYEIGHRDGVEVGRAQARGQIVDGILARARAEEQQAMKASTVSMRSASAANAAWLRQLAAEVRRGEL